MKAVYRVGFMIRQALDRPGCRLQSTLPFREPNLSNISVGTNTNFHDNTLINVLRTCSCENEFPMFIGDAVTMGHSAVLHGCTDEDDTLIGMGGTVLVNLHVEKNAMVAAGAIVKDKIYIPTRELGQDKFASMYGVWKKHRIHDQQHLTLRGFATFKEVDQCNIAEIAGEEDLIEVKYHMVDRNLKISSAEAMRLSDAEELDICHCCCSSELELSKTKECSLSEEDGQEKPIQTAKKAKSKVEPGVDIKVELLPRVMILGRPNVGKSALFNRLTKRREALVYNTPDGHVTRDIREGVAKIGDLRFVICDTAGLDTDADYESVLMRTACLTSRALSQCHLALFLIDGRAGIQPFDTEVGKWLRKLSLPVPVVLIMNKAEGIHGDSSGVLLSTLGEAHSLGFGEPVAISAETGEGLNDLYDVLKPLLMQAQEEILAAQEVSVADDKSEDALPLQLAIAGRPNVGKSTILNSLLREERVLTGPEPGLTRDAVRVKFNYNDRTIFLVDTAGWMQRSRVKEGPAALSAMHARRNLMRANVVVLVLDGEEIARARKSMLLSEVALTRWVTEEGRALVVVVNKMDLLKGKENAEMRDKVMKAVPAEIKSILPQVEGIPIIFISALEGKGRAAIMRKVFESYERWTTRLPTARLNSWLQKVLCRHPRKAEGGHGAKARYITQVKARPPTFIVFVTGAGELEQTDLRFIASALREDFNLGGIPIRVIPRYSKKGAKSAESSTPKRKPVKSLGSQLPSLTRQETSPNVVLA